MRQGELTESEEKVQVYQSNDENQIKIILGDEKTLIHIRLSLVLTKDYF